MKKLIRKILKENDWDFMDDHKVTIIDILNSVFDGSLGITVEPYEDRDGIDGIQIMVNGNPFFKSINLPPNGEISEEGVDDILDYTKSILEKDLKKGPTHSDTGLYNIESNPRGGLNRMGYIQRALTLINKNQLSIQPFESWIYNKPLKEETDKDWDFMDDIKAIPKNDSSYETEIYFTPLPNPKDWELVYGILTADGYDWNAEGRGADINPFSIWRRKAEEQWDGYDTGFIQISNKTNHMTQTVDSIKSVSGHNRWRLNKMVNGTKLLHDIKVSIYRS